MTRILIAEDEPRIAAFLAKALQAHGFVTLVAETGQQAIDLACDNPTELLILDLGLPEKRGIQVIEELRGRGAQFPIIVLTVIQDVQDKVTALEAGADDYVTKPFSPQELIARIRVQLRNQRLPAPSEMLILRVGHLTLDLRQRTARYHNKAVELSTREFTLLEMLAQQPDRVWSRQELLNQVWGYDYDPGSNIVDVYVGHLRRKLGKGLIKTVRGAGYRLQSDASHPTPF
ncbi:response regulator transcription factor [Leptothoe sp. ISB3NOV94-8A]|uniref:DNA-binding response regulator n=1 Tax=Adonisia turfae CCMR0081 TaxID=2292702 RepID=A0A6M0RHQ9_9CYAN|nr:response regulator transcription factor [Adonisia turfae]MDV3347616.1 response regulator transcription factor [Leptothoe sp. LEGE 181152]NEZ55768.1 DNA-binding response regulator [Adonisia turfae CCMR0081]